MRQSLVFQKKYLLMLIGGFDNSSQQTLAAIAQTGREVYGCGAGVVRRTHMSFSDARINGGKRRRPNARFRLAAVVVLAACRLAIIKFKRSIELKLT